MKQIVVPFVATAFILLIAACSGFPGSETVSSSTVESSPVDAKANEQAGDTLVVYSGRSDTLVQPIIDRFSEETNIKVDVRYGGTAEMAGVLLEEGDKSPADLFFAQDPGGLGALQAAGMLATLPDQILEQVPQRFASDSGQWVGTSGRARVVVYNTEAISDPAAQLPANLEGFTAPEWNGRVGWAPSNGSFQAMVTAMRSEWGDDKTREWLQAMQANAPQEYANNTPIVAAVGSGEIDAGLVNHYYLYRFLSEEGEDFPARNYFLPGGGPGSLIMVAGVGILNTARNADNALTFIDYLLSEDAQRYFSQETFEYPVIDGLTTDVNPPLAEIDALAIGIPPTALADLRGTQDMLIDLGIIE